MSSKQEVLAAQIAALQAQLEDEKAKDERKRKATQHILVAASPSPTKKRKVYHATNSAKSQTTKLAAPSFNRPQATTPAPYEPKPEIRPSSMASALATANSASNDDHEDEGITSKGQSSTSGAGSGRNADMTLVENLEPGPLEHVPPKGDPLFKTIEPYSRINLRSRSLPHDDVQEFLRGRYYVSPSMLYSIARLTSNRQAYEVPVDGDWVTIAVIAERGTVSVSRGQKAESDHDSSDEESTVAAASKPDAKSTANSKKKKPAAKKNAREPKKTGRKYINMRLVDFGRRSTDPQTGKVTIGGDALLTLLLFESDSYSTVEAANGSSERLYRGGSGGAFEACATLREGAVVAIMNARILKPFQRGTDKPHPTDNILALTPENAKSIITIGQAKDLGRCPAIKRDGNPCGSWFDKRVCEVCEFHLQRAVEGRRAARPEFASGTSGMSATAKKNPTAAYDPSRKWGLLPAAGVAPGATQKTSASLGGGTTYVMPGLVVSSNRDKAIGDVMGREKFDKKKRKAEAVAQERELERLLENDGSKSMGAKAVLMARQAAEAKKKALEAGGKGKQKGKITASEIAAVIKPMEADSAPRKRVFSATAIKRIGFDPTVRPGSGSGDRTAGSDKASRVLETLLSERKDIKLGHVPGPRIRSVCDPTARKDAEVPKKKAAATSKPPPIPTKFDDSDDDLWVV